MLLGKLTAINAALWGYIMVWALLGAGAFFTIRLLAPQVRLFSHAWRVMFKSRTVRTGRVSSFQALCTSLASRVGTGNMIGVATALYSGGPGAIFWMWVTAAIGMATGLNEAILAQIFKRNTGEEFYRGGPAYYIESGLKCRWLGIIFALLLTVTMGFIFNAVQCNSIVISVKYAWGWDEVWTGLGVVSLVALVVYGGIHRINVISELMVPIMAGLYLLFALYVLVLRMGDIPYVLLLIFKSAFNWESAAGGGLGYSMSQAFRYGVARGLFSNEAGMGSAPNAAAMADVKHPVDQGLVQMLGVFIDTILVCTATAVVILLSGVYDGQIAGIEGIVLTQRAAETFLGQWGPIGFAIIMFFFAYTTIIANSAYAEMNIYFISKRRLWIHAYRLGLGGMVMFGAVAEAPFIWQLADLFNGFMAAINIFAIVILSRYTVLALQDYQQQLRDPTIREPVWTKASSDKSSFHKKGVPEGRFELPTKGL